MIAAGAGAVGRPARRRRTRSSWRRSRSSCGDAARSAVPRELDLIFLLVGLDLHHGCPGELAVALRDRPVIGRPLDYGRLTGSPAPRVDSACKTGRSPVLVRVRNRTDPSAMQKLAPPEWPLPKAQARLSSGKFGDPVWVPSGRV